MHRSDIFASFYQNSAGDADDHDDTKKTSV